VCRSREQRAAGRDEFAAVARRPLLAQGRRSGSVAKQKSTRGAAAAGDIPGADDCSGAAGFHRPSVIAPVWGATFASKRKLYCVPQRIALADAFWACVSQAHVTDPEPRLDVQSAPEKLTLPSPSPSW
jgi:hypothetical protein